ncbi:hypothetical protein FJZ26_05555 [Candidatus Parvarchaeota archaeon]|nr:hypothetical protein [Candidatus Parvarchaeota archaeon]
MALDARILSGKQAYKIGLVDSLGNRNDALKKAAQLGGLENTDKPPVCQIEEGKGLVEEIFGGVAGGFARGVGSLVYAPALDPARGLGLKQKLGA